MKLNIGGQQREEGMFPKGWTCVDILPAADVHCDIEYQDLPFENNSIDAIYASHVLEHIHPHRYDFTVGEWHRVLKPGGWCRVVVPDCCRMLSEYNPVTSCGDPTHIQKVMSWWFDYGLDDQSMPVYNHKGGFDVSLLKHVLQRNKLEPIFRFFNVGIEVFNGCDHPLHQPTSIYVEGMKGIKHGKL